jgi:hypothetical protein
MKNDIVRRGSDDSLCSPVPGAISDAAPGGYRLSYYIDFGPSALFLLASFKKEGKSPFAGISLGVLATLRLCVE